MSEEVLPTTKLLRIPRKAFESSGWRVIELARGMVEFPDGSKCGFNVRLRADEGEEGGITLVCEDVSRDSIAAIKTMKLRRRGK